MGGAIGNLIDRIYLGAVIDFLDCEFFDINLPTFKLWFIHFRGYAMTRWPIFNIADSAVTVGICVLILSVWLDGKKKEIVDRVPESNDSEAEKPGGNINIPC